MSLNSSYTIIVVIDTLPLIVGLAVLLCASYEFEFKLSERIKTKISMEGRMLMVMLLASIKMVAVGVSGVGLARLS